MPTDPERPIFDKPAEQPGTRHIDPVTLAPFRIGADWLTLSMTGPVRLLEYTRPTPWRSMNGEPYVWMPTNYRPRPFDKMFYLETEDGRNLLTIRGKPQRGATGNRPDWMLVQFHNETLHTGEFLPLFNQLREMGFTYLACAKLDVCADGIAGNGGDFQEPIQRTWGGALDYYGKANWMPRFERKRVTGAELGTRSSNKFMRCYCKTRELKRPHNANKREYLNAAWAQSLGERPDKAGLTVNRLEISLKGKEIRRYFPEEEGEGFIEMIADPEQLANMYASTVPTMFDFRSPADRARDASNGIVWDWTRVKGGYDLRDREKRLLAVSDQSVKITLKTLFVTSYDFALPGWEDVAYSIADKANLRHWMQDAFARWTVHAKALRGDKSTQRTRELLDALTLDEAGKNEPS